MFASLILTLPFIQVQGVIQYIILPPPIFPHIKNPLRQVVALILVYHCGRMLSGLDDRFLREITQAQQAGVVNKRAIWSCADQEHLQ